MRDCIKPDEYKDALHVAVFGLNSIKQYKRVISN